VLNATERIGAGDRRIAARLAATTLPIAVAVNKVDRLPREREAQALLDAAALAPERAEVFPVSARTGTGVKPLLEHLVSLLPDGPFLYEPDQRTDLSERAHLAELIASRCCAAPSRRSPRGGVVVEELDSRPS